MKPRVTIAALFLSVFLALGFAATLSGQAAQPQAFKGQRWEFAELLIETSVVGEKVFGVISFEPLGINESCRSVEELPKIQAAAKGKAGGSGTLANRVAMVGWEPVSVVIDYGSPTDNAYGSKTSARYFFKRPI